MTRLNKIKARVEMSRKFNCGVDVMVIEDPDLMLSEWVIAAERDRKWLVSRLELAVEALDKITRYKPIGVVSDADFILQLRGMARSALAKLEDENGQI